MPTKANIVLDDDVKAELERLVASGSRSRVINNALRRELLRLRREEASRELDALRARTRPTPSREIVRRLRRDRSRA